MLICGKCADKKENRGLFAYSINHISLNKNICDKCGELKKVYEVNMEKD